MKLNEFIRSQCLSVKRRSMKRVDRSTALEIVEVAEQCPAARIGLKRGDLVLSIKERRAGALDLDHLLQVEGKRRSVFWSNGTEIEAETTAIDLGYAAQPAPEAVLRLRKENKLQSDDLLILWNHGDWKGLERCARSQLRHRTRWRRWLGQIQIAHHPAVCMLGAALWELDRKDEGERYLDLYATKYMAGWTTNFHAVIEYYRWLRLGGNDHLARALNHHPHQRIQEAIGSRRLSISNTGEHLVGQKFPVDYELGRVALHSSLPPSSKVLLVCLLGGYRGNQPYNRFMGRFRHYCRYFMPYLHGLHVITMRQQREEGAEIWFTEEDQAAEDRLPFRLLLENGEVSEACAVDHSPTVFALDSNARVLGQGKMMTVAFWQCLEKLEATHDRNVPNAVGVGGSDPRFSG